MVSAESISECGTSVKQHKHIFDCKYQVFSTKCLPTHRLHNFAKMHIPYKFASVPGTELLITLLVSLQQSAHSLQFLGVWATTRCPASMRNNFRTSCLFVNFRCFKFHVLQHTPVPRRQRTKERKTSTHATHITHMRHAVCGVRCGWCAVCMRCAVCGVQCAVCGVRCACIVVCTVPCGVCRVQRAACSM